MKKTVLFALLCAGISVTVAQEITKYWFIVVQVKIGTLCPNQPRFALNILPKTALHGAIMPVLEQYRTDKRWH